MELGNVRSIQRVVNFIIDDGKMLQQEHDGTTIPGVTMLCDLPLLFTNGLPTCLENLTVGQLEEFVPYMIQCSGIRTRTKPIWWPEDIDFSQTLEMHDLSEVKWLKSLKKLVASCYSYHGCEYALRLCTDPSHTCRTSKWINIGELGENQSDKVRTKQSPPKRTGNLNCGRKRNSINVSFKKRTKMCTRQRNSPVQIYLCDYCGSEFYTSKEIQNHEKICTLKSTSHESYVPSGVDTCRTLLPRSRSIQTTESNIHNVKTTLIHYSENLKRQTARKSLASSSVPRPISAAKEHGRDCKHCGESFASYESLHDHEASCPKISFFGDMTIFSSPNIKKKCFQSKENNNTERLSARKISSYSNNSNLDYKCSSSRKKRMRLLPVKQSQTSDCIELPQSVLLDDCDKESMSSTDIKDHEIIYSGKRRDLAPPLIATENATENFQEDFLKYFDLSVATQSYSHPITSSTLRNKRCFGNPIRYTAIPISSPLGCHIHESPVPIIAILSKLEKVERYCSAKPHTTYPTVDDSFQVGLWKTSWKPRKNRQDYSTHEYEYPLQRWWIIPSLYKRKLEVRRRNRRLENLCRPLHIKLRRLSLREIESYKSCRSLTVHVRKLSPEEICLYTNSCRVYPKLRRLSAQVIEVYTGQCSMAPKIQRLSCEEIDKHVKPRI